MMRSKVRPIIWKPKEAMGNCFLLPCREHHTPYIGVITYLMSLNCDEKLSHFLPRWLPRVNECVEFKTWETNITNPPNTNSSKLALIIANNPSHCTQESIGLNGTIKKLKTYQINHAILMIAAGNLLSRTQRNEFYRFISNTFGGIIHLGGFDDVDPIIYNEENNHSNCCNSIRDFYEIELIRNYYYHSKGFILGFCRGMQIANVAFNGSLYQDLKKQNSRTNEHQECAHKIKLLSTKNKILNKLVDGYKSINVNSFHHQAIKTFNSEIFEVAGVEGDHTIEALEFKNGRGILFQFHPEFDENEPWHKLFAETFTSSI